MNQMHILLVLLLVTTTLVSLRVYGLSFEEQYVRQLGGAGSDVSQSCSILNSGVLYSAGTFTGQATITEGVAWTSRGQTDGFLVKYLDSGAFDWAVQIGGTSNDYINSVDATDDSVYVAGHSSSSLLSVSGQTLLSQGGTDCLLSKYSSSGVLQWTKYFGSIGADTLSVVKVASDGVYVAGHLSGITTIGTTVITGYGFTDGVVLKFSFSGLLLWAKVLGGTGTDTINDLVVGDDGIYAVGSTTSTSLGGVIGLTFSLGGSSDFVVYKLSTSGSLIWAKTIGSSSSELSPKLVYYNSAVYITGRTFGQMPGCTSFGDYDTTVMKYSNSGVLQWIRQYGGASGDYSTSITVSQIGTLVLSGYFSTSASFGQITLTSAGMSDGYIVEMSLDGDVLDAKRYGNSESDQILSMCSSGTNLAASGQFSGAVSFPTTLTSRGGTDAFVIRFQLATTQEFSSGGVSLFSSPVHLTSQLDTSSGLPLYESSILSTHFSSGHSSVASTEEHLGTPQITLFEEGSPSSSMQSTISVTDSGEYSIEHSASISLAKSSDTPAEEVSSGQFQISSDATFSPSGSTAHSSDLMDSVIETGSVSYVTLIPSDTTQSSSNFISAALTSAESSIGSSASSQEAIVSNSLHTSQVFDTSNPQFTFTSSGYLSQYESNVPSHLSTEHSSLVSTEDSISILHSTLLEESFSTSFSTQNTISGTDSGEYSIEHSASISLAKSSDTPAGEVSSGQFQISSDATFSSSESTAHSSDLMDSVLETGDTSYTTLSSVTTHSSSNFGSASQVAGESILDNSATAQEPTFSDTLQASQGDSSNSQPTRSSNHELSTEVSSSSHDLLDSSDIVITQVTSPVSEGSMSAELSSIHETNTNVFSSSDLQISSEVHYTEQHSFVESTPQEHTESSHGIQLSTISSSSIEISSTKTTFETSLEESIFQQFSASAPIDSSQFKSSDATFMTSKMEESGLDRVSSSAPEVSPELQLSSVSQTSFMDSLQQTHSVIPQDSVSAPSQSVHAESSRQQESLSEAESSRQQEISQLDLQSSPTLMSQGHLSTLHSDDSSVPTSVNLEETSTLLDQSQETSVLQSRGFGDLPSETSTYATLSNAPHTELTTFASSVDIITAESKAVSEISLDVSSLVQESSIIPQQGDNSGVQSVQDSLESSTNSISSSVLHSSTQSTTETDIVWVTRVSIRFMRATSTNLTASHIYAEYGATEAQDIMFEVSNVQHGMFVTRGQRTPRTTFTQSDINNGLVAFLHDGSTFAPSFTLTVSSPFSGAPHVIPTTSLQLVQRPVVSKMNITVKKGQAVVLTQDMLSTNDNVTVASEIVFKVANVKHGRFELKSKPGTAVTSFTQAQINSGEIQFVRDNTQDSPSFEISASNGDFSTEEQSTFILQEAKTNNNRRGKIIGGVVGAFFALLLFLILLCVLLVILYFLVAIKKLLKSSHPMYDLQLENV